MTKQYFIFAASLALIGCARDQEIPNQAPSAPLPSLEAQVQGYSTVWSCAGKTLETSNESLVFTLLKSKTTDGLLLDVSRRYLEVSPGGFALSTKSLDLVGVEASTDGNSWTLRRPSGDPSIAGPIVGVYDSSQKVLIGFLPSKIERSWIIDCHKNLILSGE